MILASLFAKNPFAPVREHMKLARGCVEELGPLFEALRAGSEEGVYGAARRLSSLEKDADVVKHEIVAHVTTSVFLPVDRRDVVLTVNALDDIADLAEDLGVLLTMRWMELPPTLWSALEELLSTVKAAVERSFDAVEAVDELVEGGFSSPEAQALLTLIDEVGRLEHEADKAQDIFGKELFRHEDEMKPAALFMWVKIAHTIGDLANAGERMCQHLRMVLSR